MAEDEEEDAPDEPEEEPEETEDDPEAVAGADLAAVPDEEAVLPVDLAAVLLLSPEGSGTAAELGLGTLITVSPFLPET